MCEGRSVNPFVLTSAPGGVDGPGLRSAALHPKEKGFSTDCIGSWVYLITFENSLGKEKPSTPAGNQTTFC